MFLVVLLTANAQKQLANYGNINLRQLMDVNVSIASVKKLIPCESSKNFKGISVSVACSWLDNSDDYKKIRKKTAGNLQWQKKNHQSIKII